MFGETPRPSLSLAGSVLVFGLLVCMAGALVAGSGPQPVHLPKTRDELRAVQIASAYVANDPYIRRHLANTPGVEERWTSWAVSFAPACSITGHAGTVVTIDKTSFRVTGARGEEAVCMSGDPGWLARARAGVFD